VFDGDMAYIAQLKPQQSNEGHYFGALWHYGDVLQK